MKTLNPEMRRFMTALVLTHGSITATSLVAHAQKHFPLASLRQSPGNLSALCCHYKTLRYTNGWVCYNYASLRR